MSTELSVNKGELILKNPILTSSGTFGYGKEFEDFYPVSVLGGITIKGTTLENNPGNPPPRICETSSGMLNSIGLANIGIKKTLSDYSDYFKSLQNNGSKVIINLNGKSVEEFIKIVEICNAAGIFDYYEINVSCPNVKEGGLSFSKTPESMGNLIKKIKKVAQKPIITKLSPNTSDIREYVIAAEEAGTDIISLINTLKGMAIDIVMRKPFFHNKVAGFSGPAIKPVALYMVWEARSVTKLPIIGMGGISNVRDAVEFLMAGADAVSLGSVNFINPRAGQKIINDLREYLETNQIRLSDLSIQNER